MTAPNLHNKFRPVSEKQEGDALEWKWEEEPHARRRQEILKKYPQIADLKKYDSITAVAVSATVMCQILMAYLIRNSSWPVIIVCSYAIGATLNHSLGAAIHEIGHNLAFGQHRPWLNRALGMWCNMPLFVPFSVTYKRYHSDHHKWMGHDTYDVDTPTWIEVKYVRHSVAKFFWLLFHAVIHGIRPYLKNFKMWNTAETINFLTQMAFDLVVLRLLGPRACAYLGISTFFGLGMHPLAAHFFSEHYMYSKSTATMSYYGPLNILLYNVGYHNEHHDFPNYPWTVLPDIRRIAPEYYNDLPIHSSWLRVLWDFVFDPKMGPHAHGIGYLKSDIEVKPDVAFKGKVMKSGSESSGGAASTASSSPATKKDK